MHIQKFDLQVESLLISSFYARIIDHPRKENKK